MSSSLSATELSRLHRQRRLECSSPIHRIHPVNIKRRPRGNINVSEANIETPSTNRDLVSGPSSTAVNANSFDEEVMAANSNNNGSFSEDGTEGSTINKTSSSTGLVTPASTTSYNRSFNFSSFSVPAETTDAFKSPAPPPTTTATTTHAVTPPDSPGRRSSATNAASAYTMSPSRRPSPTPSLGAFFDKPNNSTTNRSGTGIGVSRSNSSRSMPSSSSSSKKKIKNMGGTKTTESDMPMDELMAVGSNHNTNSRSRRPPANRSNNRSFDAPLLLTDGALNASADESIACASLPSPPTSSSALVVSHGMPPSHPASVFNRMAEALQLQIRPANMSSDEENLWDVVQKMTNTKVNSSAIGSNSNHNDGGTYWEQKYEQREAEWSAQQKEHDRSLRAIQRVLADVTTEREEVVNRLKEELDVSQQQRDDTILKLTHKLKEMQQEVNAAKSSEPEQVSDLRKRLDLLQQEKSQLQQKLETNEEKVAGLESVLQQQEAEADDSMETTKDIKEVSQKQARHIEQLEEELKDLRSRNLEDNNDQADLLKELEEKSASLENAKMIIASLENANGSLALELRAKLKEKEEELATLTSTSADRKRTLDSLATELRELQRQQQKPRLSPKQVANQRALCQLLEKNVKALRQAAVQHEARNDKSSVDKISQIVSETFGSLKQNLESWEAFLKNDGSEDMSQPLISNNNPGLEATLAKKNDEVKALRKELENLKSGPTKESAQLKQEVETLKQQLAANSEALVKKGRELAVLKDSLEDNGVGYISDDGTDGDETEEQPVADNVTSSHFPFSTTTPENKDFSGTLLVHGGPGVGSVNPNAAEMSDATAAEIQMLKNEIIKQKKERESKASELQAEKESLANAKMIISSLEKANKSMLEDLRSRLQDSNTAIASLLEKSIDHEKTIAMLRKELETCRKERENEEHNSTALLTKLRDENLVFSMRLAAKDREVEELQGSLSQYEGQEVPISKVRMSSVEEKKEDDPASSDGDDDSSS